MRWFPDLANAAFCKTVELRKKILERQLTKNSSSRQGLEPSSAEFIAALAAGIDSHSIVQVGCGISTIALAVAAQATGGFLISIHTDEAKQDIVRHHMKYLGLLKFVEFIVSDPNKVLLTRKNIDFAHFTGDPKDYIELFDLLNLNNGAIVTADNALNEASYEYIQHVRRQPGMDSSTLPLARGIEVTKVASWEAFKLRRKEYSGLCEGVIEEGENGIQLLLSNHEETTTSTFCPGYAGSKIADVQLNASSREENPSAPTTPDKAFAPYDINKPINGKLDFPGSIVERLQVGPVDSAVEVVPSSFPSGSKDSFLDSKQPCVQSNRTKNPSSLHEKMNLGSDGGFDSCSKQIDASSAFKVHFQNHGMETEVSITGVNQDMLLSDITTAFSDMGISVKKANISTLDNLIEDVFFVTDAKSGAPLHPSQWNSVRDRILRRIGQRYATASSEG